MNTKVFKQPNYSFRSLLSTTKKANLSPGECSKSSLSHSQRTLSKQNLIEKPKKVLFRLNFRVLFNSFHCVFNVLYSGSGETEGRRLFEKVLLRGTVPALGCSRLQVDGSSFTVCRLSDASNRLQDTVCRLPSAPGTGVYRIQLPYSS